MKTKKGLFGIGFLPVHTPITPLIKLMYILIASPLLVYMGETIIRKDNVYKLLNTSAGDIPFYMNEWLRTDNGDFSFWMTTIAVILTITAISLITTKLSVAVGSIGALLITVYSVDYFKLAIRREPFFPWDVFQIKEATNIASDINISLTPEMILSIVYVIGIIIGAVVIDLVLRYPKKVKYYFRLPVGLISAVCVYFFITGVILNAPLMKEHGIEFKNWDEVWSYNNGGFFVTFLQNAEDMVVEAPEDYGKDSVKEISSAYSTKEGKNPNVICIMSEAFSYPEQFTNFSFKDELTPNINKIRDTSLTGSVLSHSYGGGTSISEYEVLSGNSAAFLPTGSVPYMQYVTKDTGCFYPSFLKGLGYTTVAIHPYTPEFWCRNKAYPLMGFDKFLSQDDFTDPDTPRDRLNYISDMDLTEKIIAEYEVAKDDGPFFAFAVSMQNHYDYAWDDYTVKDKDGNITKDNRVQLDDGDYSAYDEQTLGKVRVYATGVYLADEALGALMDYFEKEDSDTVIVFFGDHQPQLDVATDVLGLTSSEKSDEENKKAVRTTPYVIWNNFDEEETDSTESLDFSMYQLLPYMTEKLGLSRPAYFEYLSDARSTLAGRTIEIALYPDNSPHFDMTKEQKAVADKHWILQYDMMFGKNYGKLWE